MAQNLAIFARSINSHMPYRNYYLALAALFVLTVLEILCQVYWLRTYDRGTVSVVYMLLGLAIGIIPLWKVDRPPASGRGVPRAVWGFMALVFGYFVIQTIVTSKKIMAGTPVDYHISDVLPIMQVMSQRFVDGQEVYAIIPEIWGGMQPIYLPAMWMPYIPSVIWQFDPRWITVFFLLACSALVLLWPPAGKKWSGWSLLVLIPTFAMFANFLHWDPILISMTDEGVVIGFYVFLAWALWLGNPWLIGIALTLSVLSRVSLLAWIPFFGLYVWLFESRKKALQIAGTSLVTGLFLMLITKAIFYLDVFRALPGRYLEAVMGEDYWKLKPTIEESLGMAKFLEQKDLPMLQNLTFLTTLGAPLLCLLLFWRFRDRMDAAFFGIATLKITLVLFFNLLIIPVPNIFYTSGFLSLAILAFYTQRRAA